MITRLNAVFTSSKWTAVVMLLLIILPLAFGIGNTINQQFYAGVNEYLSERDVGKPIRYGVLAMGLVQAGAEAAIWGCCFGGWAGFAAGFVCGA